MADHVIELLSAYIDKELEKEEMDEVEAHLHYCKECSEALNDLSEISSQVAISYNEVEIPSGLAFSIMEEIQHKRPKGLIRRNVLTGITFILAATLLIIIALKIAPIVYLLAKVFSALARISFHILSSIPSIISAVPYISMSVLGVSTVLIVLSIWFLRLILNSRTLNKGEI